MADDTKPTLLRRGVLIPPDDSSEALKNELKSYVAIDYIIKYIKDMKTTVRGAGDRVLVLQSGTGSGKSTVLPVRLMEFGRRIGVTQPRRKTVQEIARDIVQRNPQDMVMGENIGYQTGLIRVPNRKGPRFMTIGILKLQLLNGTVDEIMHRYSVIVIDEVHTHDIDVDFTLRLLKMFLQKNWTQERCPLVIVMSATMDPQKYMDYFSTKHYISVAGLGQNYPVQEHWPQGTIGNTYSAILSILKKAKGDTLIFMPTQREIHNFAERIQKDLKGQVFEIYSRRLAEDPAVFEQLQGAPKANTQRYILSTDVLETGITLHHLKNVIDTGYRFNVLFNPVQSATMLFMDTISQAAATQHRGRVGRESAGDYYPLFTKTVFQNLDSQAYAQIYTSDISLQLLQLLIKESGAEFDDENLRLNIFSNADPLSLGLINPPLSDTLVHSFDHLYQLGYVDPEWRPTLLGYMAAQYLKIDSEALRMIFASWYYGCEPMYLIIIAALVSTPDLFQGSVGEVASKLLGGHGEYQIHDDFILALMMYETMVKHIQKGDVRQWLHGFDIGIAKWLDAIELVNDTLMKTLGLGLPVNYYCEPLVDVWTASKDEFRTTITRIKNCIYEGYRANLCTWNTIQKCYVRDYKQLTVEIPQYIKEPCPKYVIVDGVVTSGKYRSGNYASVMDGWVEVDKTFLYVTV